MNLENQIMSFLKIQLQKVKKELVIISFNFYIFNIYIVQTLDEIIGLFSKQVMAPIDTSIISLLRLFLHKI